MHKTIIGKTVESVEEVDDGKCYKIGFKEGYLIVDVCKNPGVPVLIWYEGQNVKVRHGAQRSCLHRQVLHLVDQDPHPDLVTVP